MSKLYLISLGIAVLIGGFIGWGLKPTPKCPEPTVKTDTLIVYKEFRDTLYIKKFYERKDTIWITKLDTFFVENYYIAEADTSYDDSLLTANVKYISDIPLSKQSYFDLKFKVKQKEVLKVITIEKEPSFWYDRFIPYLGVGLGYDGKDIRPEIQLGIGLKLK